VRDRGADGINLDFEPIASGQAANFTALVRSLRAELNAIAPGYQLTFDTTGFIGNYPIEAATAPGGADAIFLMGYDFRTSSAAASGSIAPLKGTSYDVGDAVAAYVARVPASKLILGVPYYGRVWSTQTDQPRSTNVSGTQYGASGTSIYTSAIATAAQHGRRWDATEASPWVAYRRENCSTTYGCVTSWRQLWYDDAQSLDLKYDLVNDRGLRGAGIWALGYDNGRAELDETLAANFLHDTAGPVAGINLLPSRQRDAGFVVGWSGRDVSGVASWTVQVSRAGGPWQTWIPTTTQTSGVFLADTLTGYAFRVRATDRKGNVGAWDVSDTWRPSPVIGVGGFADVRITGLAMRAGPSATTTQLGQLTTGQIISIVGGPVSAGGHTWWEAVGPLREWRPVSPVTRFWVAQGSATSPWLAGSRAPSSTWVDAVLRDLDVAVPDAATGDPTARVFSPNGDGVRDRIRIAWTNTTALTDLRLRVLRPDGAEVGTLPLTALGAGAHQLDWDGRLGTTLLPDGTYALALVGTAGGTAVAAPSSRPATTEQIARFGVRIDTTAPVLDRSSSSSAALSPNGDGRLDAITVTLRASEPVTWRGTARALTGAAAGSIVRTSALPAGSWRWDGRSDGGTVVPDGDYRLGLGATDVAGNAAGRTWRVSVDTQAPAVSSSVGAAIFSPNGDGVADTVAVKWSSPDAVSGRVEVLAGGVAIAGWPAGPSGTLAWNGRDKDNRPVRDGAYVLRVGLLDAAGNLARSDRRVVVDRALLLPTWSPGLFLPHDGDLLAPSATASFQLLAAARTTVRILTHDNRYVRTAWVDRSLPAGVHRWTWNGRAGTGNLVPRGWYRVVVTATSAVGTTQLSRLVLADAFSATLSSVTPAAGQRLVLDLRTAEPLVGVPSVTFRQTGRAAVTRSATQTGTGRYRVEFVVAAGAGPASLVISARDSRGGTNSQTVTLTVR
jgi:flagellar hook assembly protein FlgD